MEKKQTAPKVKAAKAVKSAQPRIGGKR